MTVHTTLDTPLGELLLTGAETAAVEGGVTVTSLSMPGQKNAPAPRAGWRADSGLLDEAVRQLRAYFAGELTGFTLPRTATGGTAFEQRVWQALETIPYGTTTTYGKIAEQIGAPRSAVRAVGSAIGANPLLILRPCHRVIGANGSLTGYAGGLERKEALLTHEGALQPQLG
ncbi:methylated-DNA--[protein]-cysteine S-methyltransferase [Streptomyces sp. N2-109]|uniref:Methylated-DNA--protein-cysteine methyltransferase n=1 Tax=Streptomyces gossypii TaxID=2883101 RepID=A0ABT2JNU9_9ACTN|nr:methylated-DNA--[protein]-cysteine S-methyltransferase [Streptomyces gossypii]